MHSIKVPCAGLANAFGPASHPGKKRVCGRLAGTDVNASVEVAVDEALPCQWALAYGQLVITF